ncbi:diguanylate cyclase [Micromonospora sp. WMMC415]|uniref:GGDEF domain-containing protein n=1 Tax=Micromonospora sp. WMMC415 TaxID=2675222 RepID=UPI0012B47E2B|nr:GGDEF domain-containing protein [Micromonospora sp. WMMC415]QGN48005.1 diguanylate cyclase [Micromonospora sp. WMMC415]
MHLAPLVTAMRWIAIAATTLVQSVVVCLLVTDRGELAGVIAALGIALQALLLAGYNHIAVRATDRIAELAKDLAVADMDPVTGLAVRRVAERHLFDAAGTDVTVALIDVDGMHDINTAHTHDGGDLYLAALAERLVHAAEPGELVARLGGDEFIVVTPRDPHTLAWSLAAAVALPVTIDTITRPMRVSIGICRTPGGDPHTALGQADRAMYTAKQRGSGIEHYDPARDGEPLSHGVRPAVRHRNRRAARNTAHNT